MRRKSRDKQSGVDVFKLDVGFVGNLPALGYPSFHEVYLCDTPLSTFLTRTVALVGCWVKSQLIMVGVSFFRNGTNLSLMFSFFLYPERRQCNPASRILPSIASFFHPPYKRNIPCH